MRKELSFGTKKVRYTLLANGVLISELKDDIIFGMSDYRETATVLKENSGKSPCPVLIRIGKIKYADRATSKAINDDLPNLHSAVALVIPNRVSRFFFTSFMHLNVPKVPTRFFDSEASAMDWLVEFVPQD